MKVNDNNIGTEHQRLREVAAQMLNDGHDLLAYQYIQRAKEAETIYEHLRDLGHRAAGQGERIYSDLGRADRGIQVANWLLANGWTPPVHIPIKED